MTRTFLYRLILASLIATAAAMLIALRPAAAATLKTDVIVEGDLVTLGDLFEGAGEIADQPVFRAPDLGVEGELPAAAAIEAATSAGLEVDPTTAAAIRVVRRSVTIDAGTYETLLRTELAGRLAAKPEDITVTLDGAAPVVAADATAATPVKLNSVQVSPDGGRFLATVAIDIGETVRNVSLRGLAVETVLVPVLNRAIARREVVLPADVSLERLDRRRVGRSALPDTGAIVGMAARRPLRVGDTVAAGDIEPPRVILRGELVTIVYQKPGMVLSARGRALGDAALGEPVSVLNEQSRRTVQGVATGAGMVQVEAGTNLAAALASSVVTQ